MKHKPNSYSFIFLAGTLLLAGIINFKVSILTHHHQESLNKSEEPSNDPNHLFPNELFYLDRNYPDYDASPGLYQQHLKQSIQFDQSAKRTHRGLNYPWTIEGPGNIGGRINTIAVHPFNPDIILLGYSQGGIYRTEDGGITWKPVFDDQVSLSISQITFDTHNPNKIYATTGDVNISGYPFLGSGIYRSDDTGNSWTYIGLNGTGVLSKVAVDPNKENIIYVGSMGYPSQKGDERGLFRSIDGGQTWNKTLTIDDSTGVIDLVTDPVRPGYVYASGWTRIRSNKISTTIGPGTDVYRSVDYGATWENLINGLPAGSHSRTGLEITGDGTLFVSYINNLLSGHCAGYIESLEGIFKSVDGGMSWDTIPIYELETLPCDLYGFNGWYFETLKVNPENAQDISLLGVDMFRSLDGGETWVQSVPIWWTYEVHGDKHDLVFAAGQMYLATDGGAYKCPIDQSLPWSDIENIPSTQFYRTAFNPHQPDQYVGGAQDNGTTSGNASMLNEWPRLFGGDGFQPLFDPGEPDWSYVMTQSGEVYWSHDHGVNYDKITTGLVGYRYWDMPLVMSHQDPKILFCGTNTVYKIDMRDSMKLWKSISPDLTRGDTILGYRYPAITAIAQSDLDSMRLYAGTQDGKLWTTPDGGLDWTDITDGTPGYFVTSIITSTIDPQKVFATYSGYRDNDHTPYIYKSDDAGQHWVSVGVNIPMLGVNSFLILPGWDDEVLFAATDGGVYTSFNAGALWERLGTNFPYMPVYDLEYNPFENTIVAATFSRGLMTFPVDELDLVSGVEPVSQNLSLNSLFVYPTIVVDHVTIDFEKYNGNINKFDVSIIDMNGRVLQSKKISISGNRKINLNIQQGLPQGIYFIQISNQIDSKVISIFIKQ